MRRIVVISAVIALAVAGCTGTPRKAGSGRPATVGGVPTSAGTHKQKLDVGTFGHREYLLHVPAEVSGGRWEDGRPADPPALVVALHGGLATMGQMEKLTGFDRLSDEKGFLVAYPDGFMTTWNAGDCCGPAKVGDIDDVGFLAKLIDRLTGAGLADPRRVYVTGFSNGAGMAYRMACERPGKIAAIGVVEGALVTKCDPGRPVSAMIFHGTADENVPYHGGGRRDFNDGRPFPPASRAVAFWRRVAGLPAKGEKINTSVSGARCESSGADGVAVAFCTVDGGTHRWPPGASAVLWDFFAAHPRAR
ncbi:alpha/beta hydrolase family esterase [Actinomadura decatromicini]|uniref:Polyhydroxybutyrate depolymerase n=1 Tax=Actinomadura decatromicini TaxID=2604572 RepID=A0A5D3FXQ9_9ACTN|nr:PHB depolymerase family esterase [Actinomadura decatromicini]TYK52944.1 hypothetical protein FXF68_04135 [Actinomadura decatromicini]